MEEGFHQSYPGWASLPMDLLGAVLLPWVDGTDAARLRAVCTEWARKISGHTVLGWLISSHTRWYDHARPFCQTFGFWTNHIFGDFNDIFMHNNALLQTHMSIFPAIWRQLVIGDELQQGYGFRRVIDIFLPPNGQCGKDLQRAIDTEHVYLWSDQQELPSEEQTATCRFWARRYPETITYGCAVFHPMRNACLAHGQHVPTGRPCCEFEVRHGVVVWMRMRLTAKIQSTDMAQLSQREHKRQKRAQSREDQLFTEYRRMKQPFMAQGGVAQSAQLFAWVDARITRVNKASVQLTMMGKFVVQAPWTWTREDVLQWAIDHVRKYNDSSRLTDWPLPVPERVVFLVNNTITGDDWNAYQMGTGTTLEDVHQECRMSPGHIVATCAIPVNIMGPRILF